MFIKSKYYKNAEIQLNFNQCLSLIIHTIHYKFSIVYLKFIERWQKRTKFLAIWVAKLFLWILGLLN